MKKIVGILMDFGFCFEYEHRGSMGERIVSFELGLDISNQNGKIFFSLSTPTEVMSENEGNYSLVFQKIKNECIVQTSSF